jgi:hypothetical protein
MKLHVVSLLALFVFTGPVLAKLEIVKIEAAFGVFGPERKTLDIYPLDELLFRYQVAGVKTDSDGKIDVETAIKLVNPKGKTVFEEKPVIRRELPFGGNTYPNFSVLKVPPADKAPPGEYTFTVEVRDRLSKETASFERKLTLKPVSFQILVPRFWRDADGKIPASVGGIIGESLHVRFKLIGFDKSQKKAQTMVTVQILGEDGKEVVDKPHVIKAALNNTEELAKANHVNFSQVLYLNRAGSFTLRLSAEDVLGKQTAVFETPLKVTAP